MNEASTREPGSAVPLLLFAWALMIGVLCGVDASFPDLLNAFALGGLAFAPAVMRTSGPA